MWGTEIRFAYSHQFQVISLQPHHTAAWNGLGELFTWGAGQGRLGHEHIRGNFLNFNASILNKMLTVLNRQIYSLRSVKAARNQNSDGCVRI